MLSSICEAYSYPCWALGHAPGRLHRSCVIRCQPPVTHCAMAIRRRTRIRRMRVSHRPCPMAPLNTRFHHRPFLQRLPHRSCVTPCHHHLAANQRQGRIRDRARQSCAILCRHRRKTGSRTSRQPTTARSRAFGSGRTRAYASSGGNARRVRLNDRLIAAFSTCVII